MSADYLEKIANNLATQAVTHREAASVKQADSFFNTNTGRYALGGLGGAGLGALVGAMQPKKKKRNALYYGALGGLGGLGLAHLINNAGSGPAQPAAKSRGTDTPVTASISPSNGKKIVPPSSIKEPTYAEKIKQDAAAVSGPKRVADSGLIDVGPDMSLSDYDNWKINPNWQGKRTLGERLWPGNWLKSKELRDAEYLMRWKEENDKLQREIADSVNIPFKSRPSLSEIKSRYKLPGVTVDPVNPLTPYKNYDLTDPATLDVIRRARAAGMGNDIPGFIQQMKEHAERMKNFDGSAGLM